MGRRRRSEWDEGVTRESSAAATMTRRKAPSTSQGRVLLRDLLFDRFLLYEKLLFGKKKREKLVFVNLQKFVIDFI
jgi:hypothetical protein